jgi:hypothetical protein
MGVQQMAIACVKPSPHNSRIHSARQIGQIADSITVFGFANPLLVSEDGELIAGHGRYEAARLLGLGTVPVIVVAGLSPAKQRALAIADNKIAENARWDRERLAIEIPEVAGLLSAEGLDVSLLGFEPIEVERLETEFRPPAPAHGRNGMDPDSVDPRWGEAPVVSRPGDLWGLGDHRLLCGDVRSTDDLARLMGGCRADVAFLDLPRDAMTWHAGYAPAGGQSRAVEFPGVALRAAAGATRDGGVHFVCADWQNLGALMAAAQPVYGEPIDNAVWVKSDVRSGALYRGQHEFIAVFAVGVALRPDKVRCRTKRLRSSVWHYPGVRSPGSIGWLQSQRVGKPVALIADAVKDAARRGDIVLDIFAGTGTTILAAERVKRRARALEAEPHLVDIAIRRWQAATRGNAVHAESGLSFDEVAASGRRSGAVLSPLTHHGAQP